MSRLLEATDRGLYCEAGDFYIDPWKPVERAIITHGHSDHARWGSELYVCSNSSVPILKERLGHSARIESVAYGETFTRNGVTISLFPAGHLLGSAQVRVEHKGEVWVMSGDYKTEPDATCESFEPVRCNTFITESTFGLPIYKWKPQQQIFQEIQQWRLENREKGRVCVLFAYALGKAQRLLGGVDPSLGPILVHGSVDRFNQVYEQAGITLAPSLKAVDQDIKKLSRDGMLVIAPPSAEKSPWLRKYGAVSTAFASGWMQIRGARRRRALDRGFAMSDHADWQGLLDTIRATGAEEICVTHGYTTVLVHYLQEQGYNARTLATHFEYEDEEAAKEEPAKEEKPTEEPPKEA